MMHLEFYFDYSSPWSYLGSTQVERVARESDAELVLKPFLLGGLFKSIGMAMVPYDTYTEVKQRYLLQDMHRWADHWGVPFNWPSRFPMKTVNALRLTLLAGERALPLMHALYSAYWVEDRDLDDRAVLADLLEKAELSPDLLEKTADPDVKKSLIEATNAAAERGLCGAPTFVVGDQLFWGQDRFDFVQKALQGWRVDV